MKDLVVVGIMSIVVGCLLCLPFFLGGGEGQQGGEEPPVANTPASSSSAASYTDADYNAGRDIELIDLYDESEGAAASVEGASIGTAAVERFAKAFANVTPDSPYTDVELRSMVVDYFVELELMRQAAAENGVAVSQDEVRRECAQVRAQFDSQPDFDAYLAGFGMDESLFALAVEGDLLVDRLSQVVIDDPVVSDADVVAALRPDVDASDAAAVGEAFAGLPESERESVREQLAYQARSSAFAQWFYERESQARVERFD